MRIKEKHPKGRDLKKDEYIERHPTDCSWRKGKFQNENWLFLLRPNDCYVYGMVRDK